MRFPCRIEGLPPYSTSIPTGGSTPKSPMRLVQLLVFIAVPLVNFADFFFDFGPSPFEDDADVLIAPAGYAFGIWGPIFLGMLIYSGYQLSNERVDSPHLRRATYAGILAGLASIAFVPISYSDTQWLGWLNILWHLGALIWLFLELRQQVKLEPDPKARWFYLPTQLYLGWICAATVVATALFLDELGFEPVLLYQSYWAVALIGALTAIGLFMNQRGGSVVTMVVIWALIGLIVKQGDYVLIYYASLTAIAVLVTALILRAVRGRYFVFSPRLTAG